MLDSILELVYLVDAALALPDLVGLSHWEGYSLEETTNKTGLVNREVKLLLEEVDIN